MACLALLAANAAISFNYTKDEIMSVSGVFYALLAYAALATLLERIRAASGWRLIGLALLVTSLGGAWAMRSAGLHYRLAQAAFDSRGQWAGVLRPGHPESWFLAGPNTTTLEILKNDALARRRANTKALPRWQARWWGR